MKTEAERIKHLLWLMMEFHIHRYLMANTNGRCDGAEKAERHVHLSYIYVASVLGCEVDEAGRIDSTQWSKLLYMVIHDATQEMTNHMDKVIGFPILAKHPPYDELGPKFFEEFLRLADIAWAQEQLDAAEQGHTHD